MGDAGLYTPPHPDCDFAQVSQNPRQSPGSAVLPGALCGVPTNQEVKDGHVNDAEEPVAAIVWVDLLYCVAVEGVELPPEGEKKSWGWKSQDARVLGALSTRSPRSRIPAPPSLPWASDPRMLGGSWLSLGGFWGREVADSR